VWVLELCKVDGGEDGESERVSEACLAHKHTTLTRRAESLEAGGGLTFEVLWVLQEKKKTKT
jgi:hypothetical protein